VSPSFALVTATHTNTPKILPQKNALFVLGVGSQKSNEETIYKKSSRSARSFVPLLRNIFRVVFALDGKKKGV
jgi:hypothetical protein